MYRFRNKVWVSPSDVRPDDAFALKIVAVVGGAGDWAGYQGPSYWNDIMVAGSGDKIPEEVARRLFYVLDASDLRYRH